MLIFVLKMSNVSCHLKKMRKAPPVAHRQIPILQYPHLIAVKWNLLPHGAHNSFNCPRFVPITACPVVAMHLSRMCIIKC